MYWIYLSELTVKLKNTGPYTRCLETANHTPTLTGCKVAVLTAWIFTGPNSIILFVHITVEMKPTFIRKKGVVEDIIIHYFIKPVAESYSLEIIGRD
jgi:hypothetical protein